MINAAGLQTNAIVVSIRSEHVEEFERLFAAEELPIWDELHRAGTLVSTSLTRVEYGATLHATPGSVPDRRLADEG